MNKILKDLGIDETYTKVVKRDKVFNKIKDNIPLIAHYNYMADLLFLPKTKEGFKYCLVVVDLATNEFDIEPLKDKESKTVLNAFKDMFKRSYIKKPHASVKTDDGTEFKGIFHKYLYDQDILHKIALAGRHKQLANVESLNKQLGRLFNGYMNRKEEETGSLYREWTDVVDRIRKQLNKYRLNKITDTPFTHVYPVPKITETNKYKVGDIVYVRLDKPRNALMDNQNTEKFREGDYKWDRVPRKILKVLYYSGKVPYRYMVTGIESVSYSESELMPAKEEVEMYRVKKIIGKKTIKNQIYYLVWWKGYLKSDSTYEPKRTLIKQVPDIIENYEKSLE